MNFITQKGLIYNTERMATYAWIPWTNEKLVLFMSVYMQMVEGS